jgi:hypothetical protein
MGATAMSHPTVEKSSFEEYLASEVDSLEDRATEEAERDERRSRFPHSVMLKVAYPELDFANRWCWRNFGPCDGECTQQDSLYRICVRDEPHSHLGKWTSHWFVKTDYDFGFNEWYFAERADFDLFLASVDSISWGEDFPKQ